MAVSRLAKVGLGAGSTGYRFEVVCQPDDKKVYQAGLELERWLVVREKAPKEQAQLPRLRPLSPQGS